jgi:hypothetical protein
MTLEEQLLALKGALKGLLDRLDEVGSHKSFRAVAVSAHAHGVHYTGPTWKEPYDAGRALLASFPEDTHV